MTHSLSFSIGERRIGNDCPTFIVAEISANHLGSLEKSKRLIDLAKEAGADGIKLQTYRPESMTLDGKNPILSIDDDVPGKGQTLFDFYKGAAMPWEWQPELFEYGRKNGLVVFSTPFDFIGVDFLESLDCPIYKIASFELVDIPLIRYVASKGRPMFVSVGMGSLEEIETAWAAIKEKANLSAVFLKCTSAYPAPESEMNLRTMKDLKHRFSGMVGLSDHSLSNTAALGAVALGACVIEKHFIESRKEDSPDAPFSLEPQEFKTLVGQIRQLEETLGEVRYGPTLREQSSIKYRRSIFISASIKKGEKFSLKNLSVIRPAAGLEPKYLDEVLGKTAAEDIPEGTPLSWRMVEG